MYTLTDFEPLIGQPFTIAMSDGQQATLTLTSATGWGNSGTMPGSQRQPFKLLFTADHTGYLPQNVYALNHASLGQLDIFIVPVGPDSEGWMRYEAIFS